MTKGPLLFEPEEPAMRYTIETVPGWTEAQRAAAKAREPGELLISLMSFEQLMGVLDRDDALDRAMELWPT